MAKERFSLSGYDWKVWLSKNLRDVKNCVKALIVIGLTMEFISTNPAYVTLITIAGKWLLDLAEYYAQKR